MITGQWEPIAQLITASFDAAEAAREKALPLHREVIRAAGQAIKSIHREEFDLAANRIEDARRCLREMHANLTGHPAIYHAGFVHDAQKEFAEACLTMALIREQAIPLPADLEVDCPAYLKGLAEAVGELRRHVLDQIRKGRLEKGESRLADMDEIYYLLMSFDYPDALTLGLRRVTDVARSLIEKTRGELTTHWGHSKLEQSIEDLRRRLDREAAT